MYPYAKSAKLWRLAVEILNRHQPKNERNNIGFRRYLVQNERSMLPEISASYTSTRYQAARSTNLKKTQPALEKHGPAILTPR